MKTSNHRIVSVQANHGHFHRVLLYASVKLIHDQNCNCNCLGDAPLKVIIILNTATQGTAKNVNTRHIIAT